MLFTNSRLLSPKKACRSRSGSRDSPAIDKAFNFSDDISTDTALPLPCLPTRARFFPYCSQISSEQQMSKSREKKLFENRPLFKRIPTHHGDGSHHKKKSKDRLQRIADKRLTADNRQFAVTMAGNRSPAKARPKQGGTEVRKGHHTDHHEDYRTTRTSARPKSILVTRKRGASVTFERSEQRRTSKKKVSFSKNRMVIRYEADPDPPTPLDQKQPATNTASANRF